MQRRVSALRCTSPRLRQGLRQLYRASMLLCLLPYRRFIHSLDAKLRNYSESNHNNTTFLILLGKKTMIMMN